MATENNRRPIGLISVDTKLVADRLSSVNVGDTLTYEEISTLIGRDVRGRASYVLSSARRYVFNESHLVFGVVRGVGVKRLSDPEIVDTAEDCVSRIRRSSTRGLKRMTAVNDYAALPDTSKLRYNVHASLLGIVAHVVKSSSVRRIQAEAQRGNGVLPVQRTLGALKE